MRSESFGDLWSYFWIEVLSLNFPTIRSSDWHNFRPEFFSWMEHRALPNAYRSLTCCVLLHSQGNPICTVNALMAAYRRYEKRKAPRGIYGASPRAISWSCFGKRGARESPLIARELHWIPDRDCLVSWKNPLLLYSRYWLYRNRRIDLVRAFSPEN